MRSVDVHVWCRDGRAAESHAAVFYRVGSATVDVISHLRLVSRVTV